MLDEPVASLDPLARRTFLADVMELMADRQPTIILSSHLLSDIERVCDHLIVMAEGRVQLAGLRRRAPGRAQAADRSAP